LSQKFPFNVKIAHTLKICEPHVITVTGKAFYDIGPAPANHSNRRSTPKGYSPCDENGSGAMKYWEIIAHNLKKRRWSLGWVSSIDSQGRTI
jgi:hypothetical protein